MEEVPKYALINAICLMGGLILFAIIAESLFRRIVKKTPIVSSLKKNISGFAVIIFYVLEIILLCFDRIGSPKEEIWKAAFPLLLILIPAILGIAVTIIKRR